MRFLRIAVAALLCVSGLGAECNGTLYLTIDTGSMSQAELIARILHKHQVKATFFLANEKTFRGDWSLDDSWSDYWKGLAKQGHAFGTHTWRHGKFREDVGAKVKYVVNGRPELLDQAQVCQELDKVNLRFKQWTGRPLDGFWRAPGGAVTDNALRMAGACGYQHAGWSKAGLLGDELPSAQYSNAALVDRAERNLRDGDVLLMHTGIRSRQQPFAPALDELLTRLQKKGFCFATLTPAAAKHVERGAY